MKKLNGYRPSHKNRWQFIEHGILSLQELSYLDYCADTMDFDPDHESHGRFRTDFDTAKIIFRCKSETTVRNWHNRLLDVGFIRKTTVRGEYELACFKRYIASGKWGGQPGKYAELEKNQPIAIILQNFGIETQRIAEKLQPVGEIISDSASNNDVKALGSSKDDSNVNEVRKVLIRQDVRTDEEYQQMYQNNPEGLAPDDMRWVDENVKEILEVTKENEQGVVDLYFEGNWGKYQNNLII